MLYDLEASKTLAKYATVDSGAYTGKKEVSFVNTEATYVMAQGKSDNEYGLIRISDNVSGTIAFDYTSIEKLRDYYLVGTSTGTYKLYRNVGGDPLTAEYGQKIVDYVGTHLIAGSENQYYVYAQILGKSVYIPSGETVTLQKGEILRFNNWIICITSKN